MGWSVEVKSIERKRDYSYDCLLRTYEQDVKEYGYKKAYCELVKNYEFAVEELLKYKGDYDEFICQMKESYKIIIASYMVIHNKSVLNCTGAMFLFGVGDKIDGEYVYYPCHNKAIIKKSVERTVKSYSDTLRKEFSGRNEAIRVYLEGTNGKKSALEEFVEKLLMLADEFMVEYRKKYGSVDTEKVYKEIIDFSQDLIEPNSKGSLTEVLVENGGIFNWSRYPECYTIGFCVE